MLYRIGTMDELSKTEMKLPEAVMADLARSTTALDSEYGAGRNYLTSGGYSLIVETEDDLAQLKQIIDYDTRPCEWVSEIVNSRYFSVVYVRNDDYTITVYIPASIVHIIAWTETED